MYHVTEKGIGALQSWSSEEIIVAFVDGDKAILIDACFEASSSVTKIGSQTEGGRVCDQRLLW